jgi:hypothetical protein
MRYLLKSLEYGDCMRNIELIELLDNILSGT